MKLEKLQAPSLALEYYKILDLAYSAGVFDSCHVYDSRKKPPCLALGGTRLCSTINCINPWHWTKRKPLPLPKPNRMRPTLEDLIELRELYLDMYPATPKTFEGLRAIIPEEDITDNQIYLMLSEG